MFADGDYIDLPITRKEFEDASKSLLTMTIEETRRIIDDHENRKPETIILAGGASQMPMVKREIEKAFPQYRDKIVSFHNSRAISYGTSRFGTADRF